VLAQRSQLFPAKPMQETNPLNEAAFASPIGSGPDCLFIHGFGSDRLSWLGNTLALQRFLKVHSLDLPGHGESGTDIKDGSILALSQMIENALDARSMKNVHIIGHSLGGAIALRLASTRPDIVASLSLIAPVGLGQGVDEKFLKAFPELQDNDATVALLQKLVVNPKIIGKQVAERVLLQLGKTNSRQALRLVANELNQHQEILNAAIQKISRLDIPRMVIWGVEDIINLIDTSQCNRFGGELHLIENVAHLPHIENPKAINAHLTRFLSTLVEAKTGG
jgi:pimeloyl-ACP methyl ester carboxylesterase